MAKAKTTTTKQQDSPKAAVKDAEQNTGLTGGKTIDERMADLLADHKRMGAR